MPRSRSHGALFAGGEGDIGLRPSARPEILVAVEAGRAHPVLQRQRMGVADAQPPLLGRIDQKNAAERPERLAAERLLGLLIEHDDLLAGVDQFGRGDQPGEAGADDDRVRVISHGSPGKFRPPEGKSRRLLVAAKPLHDHCRPSRKIRQARYAGGRLISALPLQVRAPARARRFQFFDTCLERCSSTRCSSTRCSPTACSLTARCTTSDAPNRRRCGRLLSRLLALIRNQLLDRRPARRPLQPPRLRGRAFCSAAIPRRSPSFAFCTADLSTRMVSS